MFISNITSGTWTQNTPISLSTTGIINTNSNVKINDTATGVLINNPGWYRVRLQSVVTGTGTEAGVAIAKNGTSIPASQKVISVASGDEVSLDTEYVVHVISAAESSQALLQILPTTGATAVNGYLMIEKMQ